MDKSSTTDIPLKDQRDAWNVWNITIREQRISEMAQRQADVIEGRIAALAKKPLKILEVGCGTGWLCERLMRFGNVTGTDLADEALVRASRRLPAVRFVSGDFLRVELESASFDVIVTLDTLSHFVDQNAFVGRIASLLSPSGMLILGTQNGPVLERWSAVPGPQPGQIRRWVNHRQLRQLLAPYFEHAEIRSMFPVGDQGMLRIWNSVKLNRLVGFAIPMDTLTRLKERAMLGHTLVSFATVRK